MEAQLLCPPIDPARLLADPKLPAASRATLTAAAKAADADAAPANTNTNNGAAGGGPLEQMLLARQGPVALAPVPAAANAGGGGGGGGGGAGGQEAPEVLGAGVSRYGFALLELRPWEGVGTLKPSWLREDVMMTISMDR